MKIIYTDEDLVNIQDISSIPGIIAFLQLQAHLFHNRYALFTYIYEV